MNGDHVRQFVMALGVLVMAVGCATARNDLVDSGTVAILQVPSKQVYLSGVSVVEKDDHVEVSGWVRKRYGWIAGDGHVDLAVLNPEGATVLEMSTGYYPSAIPKKRGRRSHFTVELPLSKFEKGSTVWVGFHSDIVSPGRGDFDCGENAARPQGKDV